MKIQNAKPAARRAKIPSAPKHRRVRVRVESDACAPALAAGDVALVLLNSEPEPGDIVFAHVGGKTVLRRYQPVIGADGAIAHVELRADSCHWPMLRLQPEGRVLGVVASSERQFRSLAIDRALAAAGGRV